MEPPPRRRRAGEDARRVAHVFPFVPAKAAADLDFIRRHSRFMPSEHFDDKPKSLGSSTARIARLAELRDPHIAPLTAFVDTLRAQMGADYRIP